MHSQLPYAPAHAATCGVAICDSKLVVRARCNISKATHAAYVVATFGQDTKFKVRSVQEPRQYSMSYTDQIVNVVRKLYAENCMLGMQVALAFDTEGGIIAMPVLDEITRNTLTISRKRA